MIKTAKATVVRDEVIDVLCNKCGESCRKINGGYDYVSICYTGGYESMILGDCSRYEFELCEPCLADLIDSLKISASVETDGLIP